MWWLTLHGNQQHGWKSIHEHQTYTDGPNPPLQPNSFVNAISSKCCMRNELLHQLVSRIHFTTHLDCLCLLNTDRKLDLLNPPGHRSLKNTRPCSSQCSGQHFRKSKHCAHHWPFVARHLLACCTRSTSILPRTSNHTHQGSALAVSPDGSRPFFSCPP